jgi:ABC-type multidrug transport system permease subunit
VIAITLLIALVPTSGSTLDHFIARNVGFLRNLLGVVAITSIIVFFSSLFGAGWKRSIGIVLGILNFLLAISILGAGE